MHNSKFPKLVIFSQQYLVQLEKDIKHHSRTVTAVINLCSLLQYDRDAGYDHTVKQELSAVRERLNSRWKTLGDKVSRAFFWFQLQFFVFGTETFCTGLRVGCLFWIFYDV